MGSGPATPRSPSRLRRARSRCTPPRGCASTWEPFASRRGPRCSRICCPVGSASTRSEDARRSQAARSPRRRSELGGTMFKRIVNLFKGFVGLFVSGVERRNPEALLELEKENLREQIARYNQGL